MGAITRNSTLRVTFFFFSKLVGMPIYEFLIEKNIISNSMLEKMSMSKFSCILKLYLTFFCGIHISFKKILNNDFDIGRVAIFGKNIMDGNIEFQNHTGC